MEIKKPSATIDYDEKNSSHNIIYLFLFKLIIDLFKLVKKIARVLEKNLQK